MKAITKLCGVVVLCVLVAGCGQGRLYSDRRLLMGTVVQVISPYPEAPAIAFKEIERVEKIFSAYQESSALSHLNKTGFLNSNFEFVHVLREAEKFFGLSGGLFDVTVGPLTKIWKDAIARQELPDDKAIRSARSVVGFRSISIDTKENMVKFKMRGMSIDMGAIAKGYAVDMAIKALKEYGIDTALVDAGGNIYCLGKKFGRPWQIGIQHPRKNNEIITPLPLSNQAVATSGDYQQSVEIDSKRYSHIIDPKTGYPVETDVVSVTVVARDAMTADSVATCVFLLGKEKGTAKFTSYPGVEKIIVITNDEL